MTRVIKKTRWEKVRSAFQTIHLWLGLIGGLFIFVICLTGTIYTFADDIKKILNKDLYYVEIGGEKKSFAELEALVKSDINSDVSGLVIPDAANEPYVFMYRKEGERRPVQVRINPYSGDILKANGEEVGAEFFQVVFKMHRWLLLDTKVGRPIVGVATIMFAIGCITGIVIWIPRRLKNWKQGLKIKTGNWKRLNHDLHNSLGFYSFIFILIMALTGLVWSFEWYKEGYNTVLGASHLNVKKEPAPNANKSKENDGDKSKTPDVEKVRESVPTDWAKIASTAAPYFDYAGNMRLNLGRNPGAPVTVTKAGTDFWAYSNSDELKINPQSLEIVEHEVFTNQSIGTQIAKSYRAIHLGTIFGMGTKIIYFISCLIATSLPITGVIIYINNLKKKRKRSKKKK